jgi:broad specificity phosphatase PhoE
MGKLFIVRHGETEWNEEGRIQGHSNVCLSEVGRQQSRLLGRRLANIPIDVAYTSDLSRATETAHIILGKRDVVLHTTEQLREYHKGIFEGLTSAEIKDQYPELYDAFLVRDLEFAPPGGENTRQVSVRLASFISDITTRGQNETVLIVGHGGSLRAAIGLLLALPLEANWRLALANCSISVIDIYPDNAVLDLYNDTSHLDSLMQRFQNVQN